MEGSTIPLDAWIQAVTGSVEDLVCGALGYDDFDVGEAVLGAPPEGCGAYLPVMLPEEAAQIGLVTDQGGCRTLAGALLGMEDDDEPPECSEVEDAIGELVNILAGAVKTRLAGDPQCPEALGTSLQLGLPVFVEGRISPWRGHETAIIRTQLGTVAATLVVLRQTKPKQQAA